MAVVAPPHLTYVNFGENIVAVVAEPVTIVLMSNLIYCSTFKKWKIQGRTLSRSMLVFMCTHLFFAITCIPYSWFIIFNWNPNFDPNTVTASYYNTLYYLGLMGNNYMAVSPVPVFFLQLDRCFALKMWGRARSIVFWLSLVAVISIAIAGIYISLLELPLDIEKVKQCTTSGCVFIKYQGKPQLYTKLVFGTLNFINSGYLFYLLRKHQSLSVKNRVVKATAIMEFFFSIIPSYFGIIYVTITGISTANVIGQYVLMSCIVDAAGCSIIYSVLFRGKKAAIQVSWNSK
ncbi:hypothetical protein DdX_18870 [Ditylenchus destructor]|uniref:Uncharacterized protein n=1 Tax=Ditylenchus destructor TaxID=166010 RepID=A0AAD4QUJ7_9BILA|nr:hypothetical protein DdX_18870 [Ditylenchus destructor]